MFFFNRTVAVERHHQHIAAAARIHKASHMPHMQQIKPPIGENDALAAFFEPVDCSNERFMVFDYFMVHGFPAAQKYLGPMAIGPYDFFPFAAMAALSSSALSVAVPGFMTTTEAP